MAHPVDCPVMYNGDEPGRETRSTRFRVTTQPQKVIRGQTRTDFGENIGDIVIIAERPPDSREDQPAIARNEFVPRALSVTSRQFLAP